MRSQHRNIVGSTKYVETFFASSLCVRRGVWFFCLTLEYNDRRTKKQEGARKVFFCVQPSDRQSRGIYMLYIHIMPLYALRKAAVFVAQ